MKFVCKLIVALVVLTSSVYATDWSQHADAARSRIIKVDPSEGAASAQFVWEVELEEGWKTYWRSPGEAGLPVRVFQGDTELPVHYPVPERFVLFDLQTTGYSNHVMMPFEITNEDAVRVDFMVCKEICIPFTTEYDFPVDIETSPLTSIKLKSWQQKIPSSATDAFGVVSLKAVGPMMKERLIVEVVGKDFSGASDVFAEIDGRYHFITPKKHLMGSGNKARFILPVMASKSAPSIKGQTARITIVDANGVAVEQTMQIPS